MPVENLPHWTILPNWRTPVLERLECLTAILASPSGAEQRYAARFSPRRMFEPLVTPVGPLRTLFDMSVGAVGSSSWYLPIWHDVQATEETLGIGDTSLNCDTLHREFKAGGFVMLWANEFKSEVLEVASVASGALTFSAGPVASWPIGTKLFPAVKARLTDMPDMSRRGPRAIENSLRFMVETENDFADPDVTLSFPTYDGFSVLTTPPDEGQDITHGRMRLLEELDNETGLSRRYDTANIDFTLQRHHWLNLGRQEHAEIRTLFYTLDGRRNLLWLPTFANDFDLAAPGAAIDTDIEVALCGFTSFGGARFGRDRIWIKLRNGTNIFRQIVGSSLTIDGTESIALDDPLGVAFTPAEVASISFMALSRLDSDTMEIEHFTSTEGASRVALNFRSAPDLRVGSNWTPPALPLTTPTDTECGALPGCSPSSYPITMDNLYTMYNAGTDGGDGIVPNSSAGAYILTQGTVDAPPPGTDGFTYAISAPAVGEVSIVATRVTTTSETQFFPFITKGAPDAVPDGHPLIAAANIQGRVSITHASAVNFELRFQLFTLDGNSPATTIEDNFTGPFNDDLFTETYPGPYTDIHRFVWNGSTLNLWIGVTDFGPWTNGSLISTTIGGPFNFGLVYPAFHYGVGASSSDVGIFDVTLEVTDLEYIYTCP